MSDPPREWLLLWSWPWATTPKSIYLYQSTRDDGPVCNCLDQQLKRNSNHHQDHHSFSSHHGNDSSARIERIRRLWNFLVRKNIASKQHLFTYIQNISKYTVQILGDISLKNIKPRLAVMWFFFKKKIHDKRIDERRSRVERDTEKN